MLTATSSLPWVLPRWKDSWIPNNSTISLIKDPCLMWIKLLRANTTTTTPTTTTTIQPTVATLTLTECCNIRQPMICTKPTLTPIPMQCGLINRQCRSAICHGHFYCSNAHFKPLNAEIDKLIAKIANVKENVCQNQHSKDEGQKGPKWL